MELTICIKMDLGLNNPQRLICHKTQTANLSYLSISFISRISMSVSSYISLFAHTYLSKSMLIYLSIYQLLIVKISFEVELLSAGEFTPLTIHPCLPDIQVKICQFEEHPTDTTRRGKQLDILKNL